MADRDAGALREPVDERLHHHALTVDRRGSLGEDKQLHLRAWKYLAVQDDEG
jgi:hypothetical protein